MPSRRRFTSQTKSPLVHSHSQCAKGSSIKNKVWPHCLRNKTRDKGSCAILKGASMLQTPSLPTRGRSVAGQEGVSSRRLNFFIFFSHFSFTLQ